MLIGAWASILFVGGEKIVLKGRETNTTHNRMELLAVIKAIEHVDSINAGNQRLHIYSDSQYVVNLVIRKDKLKKQGFITKKGTEVQNTDLVKVLIGQMESHDIEFVKVKAHQKDGDKINREVDILARQIVREN